MQITQLTLRNWRNFATADVEMQERNFLVGPNASGKSNFLDAFRFLRDLASVGGGFESAVRTRGGISRIRCLAARRQPHVVIQVTVSDSQPEKWMYRISMTREQRGHRRDLIREERVERNGEVIVERPDDNDRHDPELLRQTHLEQVTANLRFRPLAELFASIRYYHIVPQLVRESDRWDSRAGDPFGGDFIEQILRTPTRQQRARLSRIERALTAAVPQLKELTVERDPITGVAHLKGRYTHWRPHGAFQTEGDFSDGTLRLIGFLWALQDGDGPLLLEEPELSLHPEVVRQIPQLIGRVQGKEPRQVIISTHSPDILRDSGIGSEEIFLFTPSNDGTVIRPGSSYDQVRQLMTSGMPLDEIIVPLTRPDSADQLARFAS
jgi:predicted ATPase